MSSQVSQLRSVLRFSLQMFSVIMLVTPVHAEEPKLKPGWQGPQFMMRTNAWVPYESNHDEPRAQIQAGLVLWHEEASRNIAMAALGSRFRLWDHHSAIIAQVGFATNWFENQGDAGLLNLEAELTLVPKWLTFTGEVKTFLGTNHRPEVLGWQSLDVWWTKFFNTGLHSEQIQSRTLLFGTNIGVVSPHHEWGLELQYLDGKINEVKGRTFRLVLNCDIDISRVRGGHFWPF